MRMMTIVGIVLIVIGAVGLIYGGITYKSDKNSMDFGGMHLEVEQKSSIPLTPIAWAVVLVAGVVVVVADRRRSGKGSAV